MLGVGALGAHPFHLDLPGREVFRLWTVIGEFFVKLLCWLKCVRNSANRLRSSTTPRDTNLRRTQGWLSYVLGMPWPGVLVGVALPLGMLLSTGIGDLRALHSSSQSFMDVSHTCNGVLLGSRSSAPAFGHISPRSVGAAMEML